jgi:hypothetical protein
MAETDDVYKLLAKDPVAFAINAMATRPQKTMEIPWARPDMVATRSRIGESTRLLDEALKGRENFGYALADALSGITSDSTPGGWLAGAASGFGKGFNALKNLQIDRAKTINERNIKDLADILAYDSAMGKIYDYDQMPYGTAGGKGSKTEQKPRNYDFTAPTMPEKAPRWGELEIQAAGRIDPNTNVRTGGGMIANWVAEKVNPGGVAAMQANFDAYAKTFTQDRIAQIVEEGGGGRGVDTIPEINIKGGPELSAANKNSRQYAEAVQDQAYSIADQVIKANPNATITREELASLLINSYNNGIREEYRIVQPIRAKGAKKPTQEEQPVEQPVEQPQKANQYDYSKYGF